MSEVRGTPLVGVAAGAAGAMLGEENGSFKGRPDALRKRAYTLNLRCSDLPQFSSWGSGKEKKRKNGPETGSGTPSASTVVAAGLKGGSLRGWTIRILGIGTSRSIWQGPLRNRRSSDLRAVPRASRSLTWTPPRRWSGTSSWKKLVGWQGPSRSPEQDAAMPGEAQRHPSAARVRPRSGRGREAEAASPATGIVGTIGALLRRRCRQARAAPSAARAGRWAERRAGRHRRYAAAQAATRSRCSGRWRLKTVTPAERATRSAWPVPPAERLSPVREPSGV